MVGFRYYHLPQIIVCLYYFGYPTILIVKNNNLSKIYEGPRTVDGLLKFFKDNLNIKQIKKGGTKSKSKSKAKANYSRKH